MKWLLLFSTALFLSGCGKKWTAYIPPGALPDGYYMSPVKRLPKQYPNDFEGHLRQCEANRARDRKLTADELDRFEALQTWVRKSRNKPVKKK